MNKNFGVFLLFFVLVTGIIINQSLLSSNVSLLSFNLSTVAFAEESQINATDTNSTSVTLDEAIKIGDAMEKTGNDVTNNDNATKTLTENVKTDDNMKPEVSNVVLSPLKQIKEGVMSKDVVCKDGLELAFKFNGQATCVKTSSVQKLITRGWTQ